MSSFYNFRSTMDQQMIILCTGFVAVNLMAITWLVTELCDGPKSCADHCLHPFTNDHDVRDRGEKN